MLSYVGCEELVLVQPWDKFYFMTPKVTFTLILQPHHWDYKESNKMIQRYKTCQANMNTQVWFLEPIVEGHTHTHTLY